jgi:hypothetical protein
VHSQTEVPAFIFWALHHDIFAAPEQFHNGQRKVGELVGAARRCADRNADRARASA